MSDVFAGFSVEEVAGIPVLWRRETRFKTFRCMLNARRPLDDRAAARSLLPSLLLQGTARDPDRPALARRMESLFGATVVPYSGKAGETYLLRFALDAVSGDYLPDQPDQLGPGLALLGDFLTRPKLLGAGLPVEVFERERRQAAHAARAVFNDKAHYAAEQALARACAGEPMAIPEHGGVGAIEALSQADVDAARADFLEHGQMWAMACGALPEQGLLPAMAGFLAGLPARTPQAVPQAAHPAQRPRRAQVDRVDVQQSKLVLVFRVPPSDDPRVWAGRVLFASMLGGGTHSRLFREVREKLSLAYYAHAALERHKGLLQVHTGLDEAAAERVESEVLSQIEALRSGGFVDEELDTARVNALASLTSVGDSIGNLMEFTSRQWLLGHDRTPAQQAQLYHDLDRDAVAASMDGAWLDFSYLLAPRDGRDS